MLIEIGNEILLLLQMVFVHQILDLILGGGKFVLQPLKLTGCRSQRLALAFQGGLSGCRPLFKRLLGGLGFGQFRLQCGQLRANAGHLFDFGVRQRQGGAFSSRVLFKPSNSCT